MSENVVIKINVKADTAAIDRVKAKLLALKAQAEALDSKVKKLSGSLDDTSDSLDDVGVSSDGTSKSMKSLEKQTGNTDQSFRKFDKSSRKMKDSLSRTDKMLQKFGSAVQSVLKFGLKALLVNVLASAAALLSVSAAFSVARFAVKAWNVALTGAAVVGASFIAVLSSIAAGQREYNAALQAHNYKYSAGLKGGIQEAAMQYRTLAKNQQLAVLGQTALNGAFGAISKNTQFNATLNAALTSLGNFAVASGDPEKSLTAAGNFLGLLQKNGKVTQEVLDAASEVGPQFMEALNESIRKGNTTSGGIIGAILGGDISAGNQLETVNKTLFGTFKRNLQLLKEDFADLGQNFLPHFTESLQKMSNILSSGLIRVGGSVSSFGKGTFVDSLVSGFEKIVNGSADLINKYLPKADGAFQKIDAIAMKVKMTLTGWADALRPLQAGADVLKDAFGPLVKSFFTGFAGGVQSFSDLLVGNREGFMGFGESLKGLFESISKLMGEVKKTLVQLLPVFSKVANIITSVVNGITGIMKSLNGSGFGSFLNLVGMVGGYMGLGMLGKARGGSGKGGIMSRAGQALGVSGGGMSNVGTMNVTAGVVHMGAAGANLVGGSSRAGGITAAATTGGRFSRAGSAITNAAKSPMGMMALTGVALYGADRMMNSSSSKGIIGGSMATGGSIGMMAGGPWGAAAGAAIGLAVGAVLDRTVGQDRRRQERARADISSRYGGSDQRILSMLDEGNTLGAYNEYKATRSGLTAERGGFSNMDSFIRSQLDSGNVMIDGLDARDVYSATGNDLVDRIKKTTAMPELYDQALKLGVITQQNYDILTQGNNAAEAQIEALDEKIAQVDTDYKNTFGSFGKNIEDLGRVTGQTDEEIFKMSQSIGMDLTSGIKDYYSFIEEFLGVTVPQGIGEMAAASSDAFLKALDAATLPIIERQEAMVAADQSTAAMRDKVMGGVATDADYADWIRTVAAFEYQKTYDPTSGTYDPMKAMQIMNATIGSEGSVYRDGNAMAGAGLAGYKVDPYLQQIQQDWTQDYVKGLLGTISGNLMTSSNGQFGLNLEGLNAGAIRTMSMTDVGNLERYAKDPMSLTSRDSILQMIDSVGLNGAGIGTENAGGVMDIVADKFMAAVDRFAGIFGMPAEQKKGGNVWQSSGIAPGGGPSSRPPSIAANMPASTTVNAPATFNVSSVVNGVALDLNAIAAAVSRNVSSAVRTAQERGNTNLSNAVRTSNRPNSNRPGDNGS